MKIQVPLVESGCGAASFDPATLDPNVHLIWLAGSRAQMLDSGAVVNIVPIFRS